MTIQDVSGRELAILVPLVILTIWYGVQPGAILDVFAAPTEALLKSTQAAAQAAQSVASAVR
jgi:NADH-quinone oxidoreductase subunit M